MDHRMKREEAHGNRRVDQELISIEGCAFRIRYSATPESQVARRARPSIDKWMRTHGGIVARLIPVIIPRCGCGRPAEGRGGRAHNAALHGAWCTIKDPGRCTFTHVQRRGRTL